MNDLAAPDAARTAAAHSRFEETIREARRLFDLWQTSVAEADFCAWDTYTRECAFPREYVLEALMVRYATDANTLRMQNAAVDAMRLGGELRVGVPGAALYRAI